MTTYEEFLRDRTDMGAGDGFAPLSLPSFLFDFQRSLVDWAARKGRAAMFADCGLGKTPMQLVWADNVVRHTNGRILVITPLAVSGQTVDEANKFDLEATQCRDGNLPASRIVVTNYERLHYFNRSDFAGVVLDESSILKNFDGATREAITEFMRTVPYRLLCTATAAPNDWIELGTSSDALGYLGYMDMLSKFFKREENYTRRQERGGQGWRFRGHAERDFWRWVCSWARALRKPSDLGFDDGKFRLPKLTTNEHVVKASTVRDGWLFDMPAISLPEQREERRRTLDERCAMAAALVNDTGKPAVCWCNLNDESATLHRMIPDSIEVVGSQEDDAKEEAFRAFASGQARVIVTKPTIAGFGLNWQHCAHQTVFPTHSFEQYYQMVRRSWRFGQTQPVTIDVIASEGEAVVMANLKRKAEAAEQMFAHLVDLMGNELRVTMPARSGEPEEVPSWL